MKRQIITTTVAYAVAFLFALPLDADARSPARRLAHGALKEGLRLDRARDAATRAAPLRNERRVWRFTSSAEARKEMGVGIPPNSHMTATARPGHPLSAAGARHTYGLPTEPDVRMTVRVPAGQLVKLNKAVAGKPGYGELTSSESLPSSSIVDVTRLK